MLRVRRRSLVFDAGTTPTHQWYAGGRRTLRITDAMRGRLVKAW